MPARSDPARRRALQLCRFSVELERELAHRVELVPRETLGDAPDAGITIALTSGKLGCPRELLDRLPALRLIAVHGTGLDRVDLDLCTRRRITVATTPGALTDDVADLAVGLVIGLLRKLPVADRHVRDGGWTAGEFPLARRVSGKRFGIVGLGRIGRAVAQRLSPFGPVAYWSREAKAAPWPFHADPAALAAESDVLVLTCAASAQTRGMIDALVLRALGPRGYLINVARGALVDERALAEALASGGIAGAALDVFVEEPATANLLGSAANTLFTPHIGSATTEARRAMAEALLANLDNFLDADG